MEYRYGMENDRLPEKAIKFRSYFLKYSIDSREALMEWIPKELFSGFSYGDINEKINEYINLFDEYYKLLQNHLTINTRVLFEDRYEGDLSSILRLWVEELSPEIFEYNHERIYRDLLYYLKNEMKYNDNITIQRLAQIITGINIQDWR